MRISGITYASRRKSNIRRNVFILILILVLLIGGLLAIAAFTDLELPFINKINVFKKLLK